MIIVRCLFLMLSAICFYDSNALAADFTAPLASHNFFTPELKPSPDILKLAKSTWLPDSYDDLGLSGHDNTKYDFNKNDCSAYPLASCPNGAKCDKCPVGAKWRLNSCDAPYILSGSTCKCPATVALSNANDKCTQYCDNNCIKKECTPNADKTNCTGGTRACDNGCGQSTAKCCASCTDTVTFKPANSSYIYSSCIDDNGTHNIQTGWQCDTGYHKVDSTCVKDCIANNCSGYTLTSCPEGANCSSCTKTASNCSTDGTYYKEICEKTQTSCSTGYTLVNTCQKSGTTYGDCVDCRDETSPYNPCKGYYICEGNKVGTGNTCNCGNQLYYEKCLVPETCFYEYREDTSCTSRVRKTIISGSNAGLNLCWSEGSEITKSSNTCQRDGYTWYQNINSCTDSSKGTAKGKIRCLNDEGNGTPVQCGGYKYFDSCKETCLYEYREDTSCTSGVRKTIISGGNAGLNLCWSEGSEITKSSNTCQRDGYTWYQNINSCTDSSKGTAKGKIHCKYPGGTIIKCGGLLYGDNCLSECNYEDTPETCSAKGKGFTIKCQDDSGNQFGECS